MSPILYPLGLALFAVTAGVGGLSLLPVLRRLDDEQRQRLNEGYPGIGDVAGPPLVGLLGVFVVMSQLEVLTVTARLAIALPATLGLALVMYRVVGRKLEALGFDEEVRHAHGRAFAALVIGFGGLMMAFQAG